MKKIICAFLCITTLLCIFALPCLAAGAEYVIDYADVLADEDEETLAQYGREIYDEHGIGVLYCVITTDGSVDLDEYAKVVFEQYAPSDDGAIMLVDTYTLQTVFYTSGRAYNLLDSDALHRCLGAYNAADTYYAGIENYFEEADSILDEIGTQVIPSSRLLPRVVDNADLLTDNEEAVLLEQLDEISERQRLDVVVVTTLTNEGKTAEAFADDFFDYNGYGFGEEADGILLLVSMEDRDWHISTCGYGIYAFTDYGQEYMSDRFVPYLSDGDYAAAFGKFAELCDDFITQAHTGEPYDVGNMPGSSSNGSGGNVFSDDGEMDSETKMLMMVLPLVGFALAFIPVGIMASKLKTVRRQPAANSYVRAGSMRVTGHSDYFLYRTVTRTAIPQESSSGGGGGGSSTHTSSSGRSHGGSGGHF